MNKNRHIEKLTKKQKKEAQYALRHNPAHRVKFAEAASAHFRDCMLYVKGKSKMALSFEAEQKLEDYINDTANTFSAELTFIFDLIVGEDIKIDGEAEGTERWELLDFEGG